MAIPERLQPSYTLWKSKGQELYYETSLAMSR